MKQLKFKVHIYEWSVTVIIVTGKKNIPAMKRVLRKFGADKPSIKDKVYLIKKGDWAGDHYYSTNQRRSLVVVYNCDTVKKMSMALSHELCHVTDTIIETMGIEDKEAKAYLSGYIAKKVVPEIFKLK